MKKKKHFDYNIPQKLRIRNKKWHFIQKFNGKAGEMDFKRGTFQNSETDKQRLEG